MDSGVAKLPRGTGGRGKALDPEPLRFRSAADNRERRGLTGSGETLDALNTVPRTQDILNNAPLSVVQMLVTLSNGDCPRSRENRFDLVPTLPRAADDFVLCGNGLGCRELTTGHVRLL